ncbi:twin-arginine translocation signal domain-containing protein [Pseudonocardia sp.]|uniref:twin-arginine translocation signal domain-containing protein n=1 Tax=Pseudonocardia sp. TaxID=60912 RepID=UPI0026356840|nr:twin-arginine translocation signal domain-containing protein [Pseudonocardia sp.]
MTISVLDRRAPIEAATTRRRFLTGSALAVLVAGCGTAPTGSAPDPAAGSWSFTDDRGETVELPTRPTRIAAYDTAGAALFFLGTPPVAVFGGSPIGQNPNLEGVDLTGIESVGEVYGEIDIEALAAAAPELIVTAFDPRQSGPVFGFVDGPVFDQVRQLAPIVAIDGTRDPLEVIGRFEELAVALGGDVEAPAVVAARQDYDDAAADLTAALAEKPGLLAVAAYADPAEGVAFFRPAPSPGLRQLQGLGLSLVEPEGGSADINEDFAGFFFDLVSLESAGKYPADLMLLDSRYDPAAMAGVATWAARPDVAAGQIVPYRALESWSYQAYAGDFRTLAEAVRAADPDLV